MIVIDKTFLHYGYVPIFPDLAYMITLGPHRNRLVLNLYSTDEIAPHYVSENFRVTQEKKFETMINYAKNEQNVKEHLFQMENFWKEKVV